MSNKMDPTKDRKAICSTCSGKYEDHFDDKGNQKTQHNFAEEPGQPLTTQAEREKEQAKPQPTSMLQPALMAMGSNPISMGRLVEVLLEKELITDVDALYIAGFRPNNWSPDEARLKAAVEARR